MPLSNHGGSARGKAPPERTGLTSWASMACDRQRPVGRPLNAQQGGRPPVPGAARAALGAHRPTHVERPRRRCEAAPHRGTASLVHGLRGLGRYLLASPVGASINSSPRAQVIRPRGRGARDRVAIGVGCVLIHFSVSAQLLNVEYVAVPSSACRTGVLQLVIQTHRLPPCGWLSGHHPQ